LFDAQKGSIFAFSEFQCTRMNAQHVGVVVIGRNEGERLMRSLNSLSVDVGNVVYVDSGSTDQSLERAKQQGFFVLSLDFARPFTAARARNEGFAALMKLKPHTKFVQFVDGDCELIRGWLDAATSFLSERPDVAVVCGRRRERHPEGSPYNRLCDLEWDTPVGPIDSCGGDSMIRAEAFGAVGGFREELMAHEEPELCMRLRERKWKIWRLDAEMTLHDAAISHFGQWWARSTRSGFAYAEVARLHWSLQLNICKKETNRALFWAGVVPIAIALGSWFYPPAIVGALIYPLQICRIAIGRSGVGSHAWLYAFFVVLAKFPELQGMVSFHWHRLRGKSARPIEYKETGTSAESTHLSENK
jgi:GT2 family glycosyltransferase